MINVNKFYCDGEHRYVRDNILLFEKMYDNGFQSPGGIDSVKFFCKKLDMWKGMSIIDVGSGLGGPAFYFAKQYGAHVVGIDASEDIVDICLERLPELSLSTISFIHGYIQDLDLKKDFFDLFWTRDMMMYVRDKDQVWNIAYSILKKKGQLFVTDFLKGDNIQWSDAFQAYVRDNRFELPEVEKYLQSIKTAGFIEIQFKNITPLFLKEHIKQRANLLKSRDKLVEEYGEDAFNYLVTGWNNKINACETGYMKWGYFVARK